ncbi:PAS domain-containing protein [Flavobacterium sp.]|uniref:PAS domain-containing protein n=1 Tax=Flavobacterium sp. TaxID=239 RepID=UPI002FDB4146
MLEFKHYDSSLGVNFSKSKLKTMPLVNWDFYSDFLSQLNKVLSDERQLTQISSSLEWKLDTDVKVKLTTDTVVVVTCPKLKIVFASQNMERMNGYRPEEVLGKSPKIFQGQATCPITSSEISQAIQLQQPFDKVITNYCKDGSLYRCHIKGYPVFNKWGELTNFIAFEKAA